MSSGCRLRLVSIEPDEPDPDRVDRRATGASRDRPAGQRRRLRTAGRAPSLRAPGSLLPDAWLGAGCRGRPAGGPRARLEGPRQVRGPELAALLALPDRDQHVAGRHRAPPEADPADRLRPPGGPPRGRRRTTR